MPKQNEVLRQQVAKKFDEEKYNEIISLLTDELLEREQDAQLYAWRARAHDKQYQQKDTVVYANKAIEADHDDPMAWLVLGHAYYDKKAPEKAIEYYNKALKLNPRYAPALNGLGNLCVDKKEYDKAIEYYNKAIEISPKFIIAYTNLSNVYRIRSQFDKAIELYNKAIELSPQISNTYTSFGYFYKAKGEYDKAIEYFNKAIELNPKSANTYNGLGNIYNEDKDEYDKAIEYYNKAIQLSPEYPGPYNGLGNVYNSKAEYTKAFEWYNKAIELDSEYVYAYNGIGNVYNRKGEYDKAIEWYSKGIEKDPEYAELYNGLGVANFYKSDYKEAIEFYKKAIEMKPTYGRAYYNLADALEKNEDYQAAIEIFSRSIELNHNVSRAQRGIDRIKNRLAEELAKDIQAQVDKLYSIIYAIRQKSLAGDEIKLVAHYTKLLVANLVTINRHSRLHYSNVIYMNDPAEGETFLKYLNKPAIEESFRSGSYKNESSVFLGSFLPVEDGETANKTEAGAEDQLLMWRTYGKDETGMDAAGCNFVIDTRFFERETSTTATSTEKMPDTFKKIKEEIETGKRYTDTSLNPLLKVHYIHKGNILNDTNDIIKNLVAYLIEELEKLIAKKSSNEKDNRDVDRYVFTILLELSYLFKSSDYSFEKEVRVILNEPRRSRQIEYYKQVDGNEPKPPKHFYVKSEKRLLPYLRKIYLGPKVKDPAHWALHLDYSLRTEERELDELETLKKMETDKKSMSAEQTERMSKLKAEYDTITEHIKATEIDIIPSKCRFV